MSLERALTPLEIEAIRVERERALQELGKERRARMASYQMRWGVLSGGDWVQGVLIDMHDLVWKVCNNTGKDGIIRVRR